MTDFVRPGEGHRTKPRATLFDSLRRTLAAHFATARFGVLRPNRRQVAASHPSVLIGWNTDLVACSALGVRKVPV